MRPEYMFQMYWNFIKTRKQDELLSLIDMIVRHLERKGYIVYGKIKVEEPNSK